MSDYGKMAVGEEMKKTRIAEFRNFDFHASNRLDGCMWPASFCDLLVDSDKESDVRRLQSLKPWSEHLSNIERVPMDDMNVQLNSQNHLEKTITTTRE